MPDEIPKFEGWPDTTVKKDKKEITIVARYETPLLHEWARKIRLLGIYITAGYFLWFYRWYLLQTPFDYLFPYTEALSYILGWYLLLKLGLPFLLRAKLVLIFNHDYIKVKKPFFPLRKFRRGPSTEFNVGEPVKKDCFGFWISAMEGQYPLPGVYGEMKLGQLHNRIQSVRIILNNPNYWGHLAVDRQDFDDLDREDWPMTSREKNFYLMEELIWLAVSYLAAALGLIGLFYYPIILDKNFGFSWLVFMPPGPFGKLEYSWFFFLGGVCIFLFLFMGKAFHRLIQVARFKYRSGKVKDHTQEWALEEGGQFRINLGIIHWTIALMVSAAFLYSGVIHRLDAVLDQRLWGWRELKYDDGVISSILGMGTGYGIIVGAHFLKFFLDLPWVGKFENREIGIRDLVFYFEDIDPEDEEMKAGWFRKNHVSIMIFVVSFPAVLLWHFILLEIDTLFGSPLQELYFNTKWFKYVNFLVAIIVAGFVCIFVINLVKKRLGLDDYISIKGLIEEYNKEVDKVFTKEKKED